MGNGTLYIVATPIGNLNDVSKRAIEVLSSVDVIAAEDTRHTRTLLQHCSINTPLMSFHEHNEKAMEADLLRRVAAGETIALVSDAGTPLISDPGYQLVRKARQEGLEVSPIPGPSALICALSAAGLPSDRFIFEGFSPRTQSQRCEWFRQLKEESSTWIFYESSHRIAATLSDMVDVLGGEREAVIARELTKKFETFLAGTLAELLAVVTSDANQVKGEFVVLVRGAEKNNEEGISVQTKNVLRILLEELPVKKAAALAAKITGEKKNRLYKEALNLRDESSS